MTADSAGELARDSTVSSAACLGPRTEKGLTSSVVGATYREGTHVLGGGGRVPGLTRENCQIRVRCVNNACLVNVPTYASVTKLK